MTSITIGTDNSTGIGLGLGLMNAEELMIERVIKMNNEVENIMTIRAIDLRKIGLKKEMIEKIRDLEDIRVLVETQRH